MGKKLFAHVFHSEFPGASEEPAATASDPRRWVFRDLVVRRDGYAPWGLSRPPTADAAAPQREPAAEPLWPETQPGWHE